MKRNLVFLVILLSTFSAQELWARALKKTTKEKSTTTPVKGMANPVLTLSFSRAAPVNTDSTANAASTSSSTDVDMDPPRSKEWKKLVVRQRWEAPDASLPPGIDPYGFDKRSGKIKFKQVKGIEPEAMAATEKVTSVGQIIGGQPGNKFLTTGDTVYIEGEEGLQVGETYTITTEPFILKSPKSDRVGYSYLLTGKVKILGIRDNLFIGRILSSKELIPRGSFLITSPERIEDLALVAGPQAIQGTLMFDHRFSTSSSAQGKLVFIDRGFSDGVKPKMVFRVYDHYDPSNSKKVTEGNFIVNADVQVLNVSEDFSSAIVLHNKQLVAENATAILLTDVSDVYRARGVRERKIKSDQDSNELDILDQLDKSDILDDRLGSKEARELKQLERWKKNPPVPSPIPIPTPAPSSSPSPSDSSAPTPAPTSTAGSAVTPEPIPSPLPEGLSPSSVPTEAAPVSEDPLSTSSVQDAVLDSNTGTAPGDDSQLPILPVIPEETPKAPSSP